MHSNVEWLKAKSQKPTGKVAYCMFSDLMQTHDFNSVIFVYVSLSVRMG